MDEKGRKLSEWLVYEEVETGKIILLPIGFPSNWTTYTDPQYGWRRMDEFILGGVLLEGVQPPSKMEWPPKVGSIAGGTTEEQFFCAIEITHVLTNGHEQTIFRFMAKTNIVLAMAASHEEFLMRHPEMRKSNG